MSHGSYNFNLGSEILILVGDIRSRIWPNIGGTYGTYIVIVFRPKTLKIYEKIDFTQIHFLINSIWFIFYVYKQRSFETPKQILIVPNNDIYLHIVMIFYRPKLPTWSLINQFNFTKYLIWSCICILGVSRIIRFDLIWFDLTWFD